uniref:Uncharacterized protein n=1 Tax=Podoviridae sp. cttxo15 TaxID=2826584 RepID=A0A8S5N1F5_9CAUD|nr:MAG TPA: hypothetical protein [Podoviridae sp. cttxo15]
MGRNSIAIKKKFARDFPVFYNKLDFYLFLSIIPSIKRVSRYCG